MRPSCGLRRSAMSSFASTFRRVVTPGGHPLRDALHLLQHAVDAVADDEASSSGMKCTSEAPSSAAWKRIELTSRTSGASETPSSASSSVASSSSTTWMSSRIGRRVIWSVVRVRRRDLGEDLVARRDAELELVARREAQLVDAADVRRVGDRDEEAVVLQLVRQRDDALEHVRRDRGRGVRRDLLVRELDQRQLVAVRERLRDRAAG